jgi:hypothetical protein
MEASVATTTDLALMEARMMGEFGKVRAEIARAVQTSTPAVLGILVPMIIAMHLWCSSQRTSF